MFYPWSWSKSFKFCPTGKVFAYRGFSVLVPDMPGHGLSKGKPCKSIKENADWIYDY